MKYIKKFENLDTNIKKYVVLKDNSTGEHAIWNNWYGIIVDEYSRWEGGVFHNGIFRSEEHHYLIRILNNNDEEFSYFFNDNTFDPKNTLYNTKKKKKDMWVCSDYVQIYDTKTDFYKEVEKIEMEKTINKYNL